MSEPTPTAAPMTPAEIISLLRSESGFSAELKAFDTFLQAGFSADSNVFYKDSETDKIREADIVATLEKKGNITDSTHAKNCLMLVVEVKSSSAPTVVLSSPPAGPEQEATFFSRLFYQKSDDFDIYSRSPPKWSLKINAAGRIGRTVLKVLSSRERKDKNRVDEDWFRGFLFGVVNATDYFVHAKKNDLYFEFIFETDPFYLVHAMSVLVIDGPLYELYYKSGIESLETIEYCITRVSLPIIRVASNHEALVQHRLVAICSLDGLPGFLKSMKTWFEKKSQERLVEAVKQHRANPRAD